MKFECGRIEECGQCAQFAEPYRSEMCSLIGYVINSGSVDAQSSVALVSEVIDGLFEGDVQMSERRRDAIFVSAILRLVGK